MQGRRQGGASMDCRRCKGEFSTGISCAQQMLRTATVAYRFRPSTLSRGGADRFRVSNAASIQKRPFIDGRPDDGSAHFKLNQGTARRQTSYLRQGHLEPPSTHAPIYLSPAFERSNPSEPSRLQRFREPISKLRLEGQ
jgi:hypothetical protein